MPAASGPILVVEDSPTERLATQTTLKAEGYRVVAVENSDAALEALARERPALILLDVVMPGVNGFQLCRQLKGDPATRDLPIVLVTSKGLEADRFWGLRQGANDYLVKPVAPAQLLACVRRQIEAH